jgi:hypothetical protein
MTTATVSAAAPTVPRARLARFQQAMLSLYWFATSAHWAAILSILLPRQALAIGGDEFKGSTLGVILARRCRRCWRRRSRACCLTTSSASASATICLTSAIP